MNSIDTKVGVSITPDLWDRDKNSIHPYLTVHFSYCFVPPCLGQLMGQNKERIIMNKSMESSRSWFCVLNNPAKIFGEDTSPSDMVDMAINLWIKDKPQRTCAVNYEIGDNGTPHMHMVLEDPSKSRFTAVQKLFPSIHIERTRGSKEQAEDYINKRGRFEEKGHTVVIPAVYHGSIKASQGIRNDLQIIEELIEQGKKPSEITSLSISFMKHETLIKKCFFQKRFSEIPLHRKVTVYWHVGDSGSGKTYSYIKLMKDHPEDVYLFNDYDGSGFDLYEGQSILFMDEFKGNIRFQLLLNLLDSYKIQLHCRYTNSYALWDEVHISSIYPPEEAYRFMVDIENQNKDPITQLLRRIDTIVYHYKNNDKYMTYSVSSTNYTDYQQLKDEATKDIFISIESSPFD